MAESPWWHLTSGSRPAYLHAGAGVPAVDQVQEIVVNEAAGKSAIALSVGSTEVGQFANPEAFATELGYIPMTAARIQAALEGPYGAGEVTVTEHREGEQLTFKVTAPPGTPLTASEEGVGTVEAKVISAGKAAVPDGEIYLTVENLGDESVGEQSFTTGELKIADVLPPGLKAVGIAATKPSITGEVLRRFPLTCTLSTLSCILKEKNPAEGTENPLRERLAPYDQIEIRIAVIVEPGAHTGENAVSISGGEGYSCHKVGGTAGAFADPGCAGAPAPGAYERSWSGPAPQASLARPVTISEAPVPFGVEEYELTGEEDGGSPVTQAGSHPFQLTTTVTLNQGPDGRPLETESHKPSVNPVQLPKDVNFNWPAGLIGNPSSIPQCTDAQFYKSAPQISGNYCPAQTAVGVATVIVNEPSTAQVADLTVPLFNLKPRVGEPARFGFNVTAANTPVVIDTAVRTGGDYGIVVSAQNLTQTAALLSSQVTVWGVPGDPRHNSQRGWTCLLQARGFAPEEVPPCSATETLPESHPPAFISYPTSCTGSMTSTVFGDSWANLVPPAAFPKLAESSLPALEGCSSLGFGPEFSLFTEKLQASTPTGVTADLKLPQESASNAAGLAPSDLRATTVTLPEGVQVNASSAGGLEGCTEAQAQLGTEEEASCPDGSKLANVTVSSPLIPNPLKGFVYLASPQNFPTGPQENPFGTLVAAYVIVKDPISGVLVKLAGEGKLNETTGQITLSFTSPQLPFEDAKFEFFGGDRAPVATPAHCGSYTTHATFTPWSGNPPVNEETSFKITTGPGGTPCPPAALPFAPTLAAGTTSNTAASFSPLTTTISREDGEQFINSVTLHMPPGLTGVLTGVPLCPEAQANAGTCSSASLIGHTTASVGIGKDPFTVTGGQVFLTQGYKGASFGLSIVTPAVAGPFNLGNVIVRAKVEINPTTAALTVTTDEIPHILKGIPLEIKRVNVVIDREHFTLNPTSCNPMSVTGTIGAVEGATAPVSDPFQATNCAALKFTPTVAVATAGKASKPNGASLNFKIAYPPVHGSGKGALGTQSWFNEAKFTLPKQLPARLTTIQKACDSKIFEGNRAACPAGSKIGTAIVHTPVLPVPLEGPVYFVSYGNAQFPEAVLVLDGYGVHIELHGETFIGKGITSATFRNTPDVPFESIEVTLPTGPFSEFGANLPHNSYNFCGQKLVMPTLLKAQNGLEIHQNTPVGVSGCPPSVSITKTAVKGNSVAVTVKLGQQGTVKITGRGLRTTTKRGLKAGTRVINVPLTAVGRAAKRHKGKLKVQASLTVSGRTGTATATLRA
jgi:hypothetical protein